VVRNNLVRDKRSNGVAEHVVFFIKDEASHAVTVLAQGARLRGKLAR
jgi:hypothetical protein